MKLSKEEKILINEHIKYQREIRKMNPNYTREEFEQKIEYSLFEFLEFLKNNGFLENGEKRNKIWKYVKNKLS